MRRARLYVHACMSALVRAHAAQLLYIERHRTFDIDADTPLTLRIVHTCDGSALGGMRLPPCAPSAGGASGGTSAGVGNDPWAAHALSASLMVLSGGTPPARPGAPWLRHLNGYDKVLLLWAPPAHSGSAGIERYTWVEFISGRPVLTGDAIALLPSADAPSSPTDGTPTFLSAELSGYRKGYGILPGALAAVSRGAQPRIEP